MAKMNVRISREYVEDQAQPEPPKDYTNAVLAVISLAATVAVAVIMAMTVR
jgi:hypothetical protein